MTLRSVSYLSWRWLSMELCLQPLHLLWRISFPISIHLDPAGDPMILPLARSS
jgi:hypothetical protein